jgi:DNA helicase HerA-like ATPase
VLAADKLMRSPKLYATFLLWLLAELFETLPEVGDPEKPRLVFFFDEAHLLFDEVPGALEEKIEQVVRLIRSKGVGVYFVTQNPIDIPEEVAGQLGNRVQHALRAFTPRDQKAIKAASETFRINPDLDVEKAITELKVGEALVSTLQADGSPSIVQRTLVKPPRSRLGPVSPAERAAITASSPCAGKYDTRVDRESAEEVLAQKAADAAATAQEVAEKGADEVAARPRLSTGLWGALFGKAVKRATSAAAGSAASIAASSITGRKSRANPMKTAATSAAGSIATDLAGPLAGRFVRNLLGGLMR